jgi:hypothetical protein
MSHLRSQVSSVIPLLTKSNTNQHICVIMVPTCSSAAAPARRGCGHGREILDVEAQLAALVLKAEIVRVISHVAADDIEVGLNPLTNGLGLEQAGVDLPADYTRTSQTLTLRRLRISLINDFVQRRGRASLRFQKTSRGK